MSSNTTPVGLRHVLIAATCLLPTVLSFPFASMLKQRATTHRAYPLARTNRTSFRFKHAPPSYTPIMLSDLIDSFGDVVTVEPTTPPPDAPTDDSSSNAPPSNVTARSVIGTDTRTLVKNTSYPYSAMGRLLWSDNTYCTASLMGDRFIVTASHCVPWDNTSMTIIFQPDFYDTEVFGHATVTDVAYIKINDASSFDGSACGVYYDYAILRLDTVLSGRVGGTLGATQWNSSFANVGLKNLGYPLDLGGGARPYVSTGIKASVSSSFQCQTDGPLSTTADSSSGESGGPLWIPTNNGTQYLVGVLSAATTTDTAFASGSLFVSLVAWGKANWPA